MSIEDRVMDVLLTASFADADARLACEEKLRSLIGERDRALTNEYIAKSNRDEMIPKFKHLFARAEAAEAARNEAWTQLAEARRERDDAEARAAELEKALEKSGALLLSDPPKPDLLLQAAAAIRLLIGERDDLAIKLRLEQSSSIFAHIERQKAESLHEAAEARAALARKEKDQ